VKVLVDEMYPATVAEALRATGIDATAVADLRLGGAPDAEIFGVGVAGGFCVLTDNVGDFALLAADHSTGGGHHAGLLIALSSRFSRRPAGPQPLVDAIRAIADEPIEDRIIYLERWPASHRALLAAQSAVLVRSRGDARLGAEAVARGADVALEPSGPSHGSR
jgi:Domain of unknown function (DUF5615)